MGNLVITACNGVTEQEVLAAEDARYLAQTSSAFGTLEKLLGDDLIYQHSTGKLDFKTEFILALRSGLVKYRHMERREVIVRTYGSVGIITGIACFEVTVNEIDGTANIRFHSVWVKRGNQLQLVSWQATPLA